MSFALDWFVDVGGFLDRLNSKEHLERYEAAYSVSSVKAVTTLDVGTIPSKFTGTVSRTTYHRWVGPVPIPSLSLSSPISTFNHWLEGGALIIQRRK